MATQHGRGSSAQRCQVTGSQHQSAKVGCTPQWTADAERSSHLRDVAFVRRHESYAAVAHPSEGSTRDARNRSWFLAAGLVGPDRPRSNLQKTDCAVVPRRPRTVTLPLCHKRCLRASSMPAMRPVRVSTSSLSSEVETARKKSTAALRAAMYITCTSVYVTGYAGWPWLAARSCKTESFQYVT